MANNVYAFTALTGGAAGALDAILGALLATGDLAFGVADGKIYAYKFDAGSSAAETSPSVIAPDSGDGRWLLATNNVYVGTFTRAMDAASGDVSYTGTGFTPSFLIMLSVLGNASLSIGLAGSSHSYVTAAYGAATTYYDPNDSTCIWILEESGKEQKASLKTFDSNGFTLTWTKVGSPASANAQSYYIAFR